MGWEKILWVPIETYGDYRACFTIDHSSGEQTDNGFLDCVRAFTPGAGSHDSTSAAATNLLNCFSGLCAPSVKLKKGACIIYGHGNVNRSPIL